VRPARRLERRPPDADDRDMGRSRVLKLVAMLSMGAWDAGRRPARAAIAATVVAGAALCVIAVPDADGAALPGVEAKRTGRYLVVFEHTKTARSSSKLAAVLTRAGARRAGKGVPQLGIATVRGSTAAIRALRRDPRVESVSVEYARALRRVPNDPALHVAERDLSPPTAIQWALSRQRFPTAWNVTTGGGAIVGVIDTGIDGAHPEFRGKLRSADQFMTGSSPTTDPEGHGTHVSGLACAATNNGVGVAGAGWGCRLAVVKVPSPFIPDAAIADGIRRAVDRGAHAINMSFGGGPPSNALEQAIRYAVARRVVLVAAASNESDQDQGAPASQLQPGDAPDISRGRGLVVTAADFSNRRAGTGRGRQISLAAYGFYDEVEGPPGLISTYPDGFTQRDVGCPLFCSRRTLGGDDDYAYLQGTSMAAPQVTAVAALVNALNPFLPLKDRLRVIKQTARRSGGWSPELGWGLLDAGGAIGLARRTDRLAPTSKVTPRYGPRLKGAKSVTVRISWTAGDPAGRAQLIPSGIRSFDLYMKKGNGSYVRIRRGTTFRYALPKLGRGTYRFYTRALDRSGNREAAPRVADDVVIVKP
jgi:serine protease